MTTPSRTCRDRRHRGFSLVELLVVIAIIGFLIAIILPELRVTRETARRVQCASQLHQIGTALLGYANNNQGWLPAWSGWHTWPPGQPEDQDGPAWTIELTPYLGADPDSPIYNCPSFPGTCRNYFLSALWASLNGRNSTNLTGIKMTSRFVLSGDLTQLSVYPPPFGTSQDHTTADADYSDEGEPLLCFPDEGGFQMHLGGSNVLFDDMHVEAFTHFSADQMTFHPQRMLSWSALNAAGPDAAFQPARTN